MADSPVEQTAQDRTPTEGVLLPSYTPRWLPWLKGIAAVTVFIFTFTSILPAGYAQQQPAPAVEKEHLRSTAIEESTGNKAGLEETLKGSATAVPDPNGLTRRQFNQMTAAAFVASLLGITLTPEEAASQELPERVRTAFRRFLDARRITGTKPVMPANLIEDRMKEIRQRYRTLTGEDFTGFDFNGLFTEFEPGARDAPLTQFGRFWPYGNALILQALVEIYRSEVAAGRKEAAAETRREVLRLMNALVRLGKTEQALGYDGGYHFSYNTNGDNFIHPVEPTGNNLWVAASLYSTMRELGEWTHLEWVNSLRRRVLDDLQVRNAKDLRDGLIQGGRYTYDAGRINPRTKRAFDVDDREYIDEMGYRIYRGNLNRILEDISTEHQFDAMFTLDDAVAANLAAPGGTRGKLTGKDLDAVVGVYRRLAENINKLWVTDEKEGDHFITGMEKNGKGEWQLNRSVAVDNNSWAVILLAYNQEMAWKSIQFVQRHFVVRQRVADMQGLPAGTKVDPKETVIGNSFFDPAFMDRFIQAIVPADDPGRKLWAQMLHPEATFGFIHFLRRFAETTRDEGRRKQARVLAEELTRGMQRLQELYGGKLPNATLVAPLFTTLNAITPVATGLIVALGGRNFLLPEVPKILLDGITIAPRTKAGAEETSVPNTEQPVSAPVAATTTFWAARPAAKVSETPLTAAGAEEKPSMARRDFLKTTAVGAGLNLLGITQPSPAPAAQPVLTAQPPAIDPKVRQGLARLIPNAFLTQTEGFVNARKIPAGAKPVMPVLRWLPKEILQRYQNMMKEEFRGFRVDGLFVEYAAGNRDRVLTDYGRTWIYTQALTLYDFIAQDNRREAEALANSLVRLGRQFEALGYESGWPFSLNTNPEEPWMDPRAPTGNTLWAMSALYATMIKYGDYTHLEWVNRLLRRMLVLQITNNPKDPRYGLIQGMRYNAALDQIDPKTKRPYTIDPIGYRALEGDFNRVAGDIAIEHQFDFINTLRLAYTANEAAAANDRGRLTAADMNLLVERHQQVMENIAKLWVTDHFVTGMTPEGRLVRNLKGGASVAVDNNSWAGVILPYNAEMAWASIQYVDKNFLLRQRIREMQDLPKETLDAVAADRIAGGDTVAGLLFFPPEFNDRFIEELVPSGDADRKVWGEMLQPEATFGFIDFLVRFAEAMRPGDERRARALQLAEGLLRGMMRAHELYGRGGMPYATRAAKLFTTLRSVTATATGRTVVQGIRNPAASLHFLSVPPPEAMRKGINVRPPAKPLEVAPARKPGESGRVGAPLMHYAGLDGVGQGQRTAAGVEEKPSMTRRGFLKTTAVGAAAAAIASVAGPSSAQGPQQPGVAVQEIPSSLTTGEVNEENTFVLNYANGATWLPKARKLSEHRGLRATRSVVRTLRERWGKWFNELGELTAEVTGWSEPPPPIREVWTDRWDPGRVGTGDEDDETALRSYVVWAPWVTDKRWWPVLFRGMRKAAGLGPDKLINKPHSRIYLDPYGVISPFRPWDVSGLAEFIDEARSQGVEVVLTLGDPGMALFPTSAIYLLRALTATLVSTKSVTPNSEEVVPFRVAFDIELTELDDYKTPEKYAKLSPEEQHDYDLQQKEYWENIFGIAAEVQDKLFRGFQPRSRPERPGVEVSFFVPPDFFRFAEKMKIKVPPGVHLNVMAYSNSIEGIVNYAKEARDAFIRDRNRPAAERFFEGVTYSIAVDIGPHGQLENTLWRDSNGRYTGRIGDRTREVGTRLDDLLSGQTGWDGEKIVHTHSVRDLIWFLREGGPSPSVAAAHEMEQSLKRVGKTLGDIADFLSSQIHDDEGTPYRAFVNNKPIHQKLAHYLRLLAQRLASGAVGTGAILAHLKTVRDTMVRMVLSIDPDAYLFGSDIGVVHSILGVIYSENFGQEARILRLSRTLVDPAAIGLPVTLEEEETVEVVRLRERFVNEKGEVYAAGALLVAGTVLPAAVSVSSPFSVTGDGRTVQVLGTRLHGENNEGRVIIPGRAINDKENILADGKSRNGLRDDESDAQRRKNDLEMTQFPTASYDIYWTAEVKNLGEREFKGFIQLRPHIGFGEAHDVQTKGTIALKSGDSGRYTMQLRVGEDDYDRPKEPEERLKTNPFVRKSRLPHNLLLAEGAFLISHKGGVQWGEIAHAVGLVGFDSRALNYTLRDRRYHEELETAIRETVRRKRLSEVSPYSLERVLGVQVSMPAQEQGRPVDLDEPRRLVQSVADRRDSHGVTHLMLESQDLRNLIRKAIAGRQQFATFPNQVEQFYEDLAKEPEVKRLLAFLDEAYHQNMPVGFAVRVEDIAGAMQGVTLPEEDPQGVRLFFSTLGEIIEHQTLNLGADDFLILVGQDRIQRPVDRAVVSRIFLNAQDLPIPLMFLGERDTMVSVRDEEMNQTYQVPQAQGLAGLAHAEVMRRLEAARGENRSLGMAFLTPEQLEQGRLLRENEAGSIVRRMVGDFPADPERHYSEGGIVTARWLAEQLEIPRGRLAILSRVIRDTLELSTISPATTGHLDPQAERFVHDPTRMFYLRVRVTDVERSLLTAFEIPVSSLQVDLNRPMKFVVRNLPVGWRYAVSVELSTGSYKKTIPGHPQLTSAPILTLQDLNAVGRPSSYSVVSPGSDNWVMAGPHRLNLAEERMVQKEVEGAPQLVQEHWTLTTEDGQKLHFGREPSRDRAVFWTGDGPARVLAVPRNQSRAMAIQVGQVPVQLRLDRVGGRISLEVAGKKIDLWSRTDLRLASRWEHLVPLRLTPEREGENQPTTRSIEITAQPNNPLLSVRPLNSRTPMPAMATRNSRETIDTTAMQITSHSDTSELLGEAVAHVTGVAVAAKTGKRIVDKVVSSWRRAKTKAWTSHDSGLTRNPVKGTWFGWIKSFGSFLWVTAVTAGFLFLMAQVPAVALLMGVGSAASWSPMGWLVKVILFFLAAKWIVDGPGALVPRLGSWINKPGAAVSSKLDGQVSSSRGDFLVRVLSAPGALLLWAGGVLVSLASAGRLTWAGIAAAAAFVLEIPGLKMTLLEWGILKLPVAGAELTLVEGIGAAGSWILAQPVTHPVIAGVVIGAFLLMGVWHLVHVWKDRGKEGLKDLGRHLLLAAGVVGALAWVFFGGGLLALGTVTVFKALQWYLVYRLTFFISTNIFSAPGYPFAAMVGAMTIAISLIGWPASWVIPGFFVAYLILQASLDFLSARFPLAKWINDKLGGAGTWNIENNPIGKLLVGALMAIPAALMFRGITALALSGEMAAFLSETLRLGPEAASAIMITLTSSELYKFITVGLFTIVVLKWPSALYRKVTRMFWDWWGVRPSEIGSAGIPVVDQEGYHLDQQGGRVEDSLDPNGKLVPGSHQPPQMNNRRMSRERMNEEEENYVLLRTQRQANDFIRAQALLPTPPPRWNVTPVQGDLFPYLKALIKSNPVEAKKLLKGFSLRPQEVRFLFQLDQSAQWEGGMLNTRVQELLRGMEADPTKVSAQPAIFTYPRLNRDLFQVKYYSFYYGGGVVIVPVLWFSQGLQYVIAMDFRFLRGFQEGMNSIVLIKGVESDMENNVEDFIDNVMGRWMEGHKADLMKMLSGDTLHLDPNVLKDRIYERRYRNVADLLEDLEIQAQGGGIESAVAKEYLLEPGSSQYINDHGNATNMSFGIGPLGRPTHLNIREWGDNPMEGGPDNKYPVTDEDALQTSQLDSGHWVIRVLGPTGNLLYSPFNFTIDEKEEVVRDPHPAKYQIEFRGPTAAGRPADLGTPTKAYWMGSAMPLLLQKPYFKFEPRINSAGSVEWVTPFAAGMEEKQVLAEMEAARRGVVGAREQMRDAADEVHWENSDWLYTDGKWYTPAQRRAGQVPKGHEAVGPMKGHKPYDSLYGKGLQLLYRLGDWITGRRFATVNSFTEFMASSRKTVKDFTRSLPYWVSSWAGVLLGIGMLYGVVPTGGMSLLPFALVYLWLSPLVGVGMVAASLLTTGAVPWLPWALIIASSILIGWLFRNPQHVVSYYGPRKHAVSEAIEASADPADAIRLTKLATEGLLKRRTSRNRLPPLPDNVSNDAEYVQFVKDGEKVMREAGVYDMAVQLGRAVSPEDYRRYPNTPRGAWERYYAGQVRSGLRRWYRQQGKNSEAKRGYAAAQRAVLQIIRREHFAVGEEMPASVYTGTRSPDVPGVGLRSVPTSERRLLPGNRVEAWMAARGINRERGRTWGMFSEAVNVVPRVSSRFGMKNRTDTEVLAREIKDVTKLIDDLKKDEAKAKDDKKRAELRLKREDLEQHLSGVQTAWNELQRYVENMEQEWTDLTGHASAPVIGQRYLDFYREHSHLQPDTDEIARTVGQRSREETAVSLRSLSTWPRLLLSPRVRYGGMLKPGDDSRRLGGTTAVMAAAVAAVGFFAVLQPALAWFGITVAVPPVGIGLAIAAGVGILFFDHILFEASHALDNVHRLIPGWWGGRLQGLVKMVFQGSNRLLGAGLSLGVGIFGSIFAYKAILALSLGWGALADLGIVAGVAAVVLLVGASAVAFVASLLSMRWDAELDHGMRGDGLRALSLIPGILIQYPLVLVFKAVVLTLNNWIVEVPELGMGGAAGLFAGVGIFAALGGGIPAMVIAGLGGLIAFSLVYALWDTHAWRLRLIIDVPKSLDLYISSLLWWVSPYAITGLIDRMEYPLMFGAAFAPGKLGILPGGRLPIATRRATAIEASEVPWGVLLRLKGENPWTRFLTGMSGIVPDQSMDYMMALAEDTLYGWMRLLKNTAEPASPAVSAQNMNDEEERTQERSNDEGGIKRAYQFYKGMGMAQQITSGDGELVRLINRLVGAFQRDQVVLDEKFGAGVYGYLFTAFTARQLYKRMVEGGLYAPGEVDAFFTFLYYVVRDRALGGALSRQLFQMNQDQGANPLRNQLFVGGTLESEAVRAQLLKGWAVDPKAAIAAARAAIRIATDQGISADRAEPLKGITQVVDLRNVFSRTLGGIFGTYQLDPVEGNARLRRVVDLLHWHDKHRVIRLRSSIIAKTKLVQAQPLGTDVAPEVTQLPAVQQPQAKQSQPPPVEQITQPDRQPPAVEPVSQSSQSAGLEEGPRVLEHRLDLLLQEIGTARMNAGLVKELSREWKERSLPAADRPVEEAMLFARKRQQLQEGQMARAMEGIERTRWAGSWIVNEGALPEVFVMEGRQISWAPFLVQLKIPVGVVADTMAEADGLKGMFERLKVEPALYEIVSVELEGSEEAAREKIRARFPEDRFRPVVVNRDAAWAQVRDFLEKQGIYFPPEITEGVEQVASYLESLA